MKCPPIFHATAPAVITKVDLAEAVEFDSASAARNIQAVRPDLPFVTVSAKSGQVIKEWLQVLVHGDGLQRFRPRAAHHREAVHCGALLAMAD